MRRLMLLVAIFVMTVTALLLPVKKHEVEALAENLWTSDGWWKKHPPSTGWPVHRWERKEYGLKWAWLVVDSGISCDDWYAKVDPIYFLFYCFLAAIPGLGVILVRICHSLSTAA